MSSIRLLARSVAVAALVGTLSQTANATDADDYRFDTTQDLYDICSVEAGAADHVPAVLACRAFIEASVQYHDAVSDRKNLKRLICYPKSATIADGRKAFLAWAKEHSGSKKRMNEMPVIGLVRALSAKYPCS